MISLVLIAPDALKDHANAVAEAAGWGPGNLTRRLSDAQGGIWWACRADARPADMARFADPSPEGAAVLAQLIVDPSESLTGLAHFEAVLEEHGLTPADEV